MAKIQHHSHPKQSAHPVKTPSKKAGPTHPKSDPPAPKVPETKDHFLRVVAEAVYQNHPLVMLCTQPQLRSVASKIPVIKDLADAVCPIVRGTK